MGGNQIPTDSIKETSVQTANATSGLDVGAISGAAVAGLAAAALAVLAVVRYRRAESIWDKNERKSDERLELAMLSRRSAIVML
ncbi:hypothetical protein H310_14267 [Aphanomyces invadans]|uniref:Uncharacterized protein n=1 Tax=Aphanomyces invadans TaxID=157072 RepID=A0A024TCG9_9STRA|nr:hypothetical protein H310_14267 [Aphanomyces invadans]ETV91027.1 hypothetical protein H310_14267 [Aphanomyces invadans]|eukprot:XP_008880307.1 hypothetical protein H310_14267 [Aphanomyces invadans]